MSEITVVARAKVKPGLEDEMERALRENAEASRCEGGCLAYSVLRGDDGAFMTVERWRTRADVDQHMAAPHVQTLFAAIGPLLEGAPEITMYKEI
ncbi:MAG: putative quinol monooxygenase [Acidobacteriota bacterium]